MPRYTCEGDDLLQPNLRREAAEEIIPNDGCSRVRHNDGTLPNLMQYSQPIGNLPKFSEEWREES